MARARPSGVVMTGSSIAAKPASSRRRGIKAYSTALMRAMGVSARFSASAAKAAARWALRAHSAASTSSLPEK